MAIEVQVLFNRLPEIANGLAASTELGADAGLALLEQAVYDNAPVLTGGLQASTYRITSKTNEFAASAAAMANLNPNAHSVEEPQVEPGEGVVGAAADYAVWVNDGHATTSGGFVPANPYFTQAVEDHAQDVLDAIRNELAAMMTRHSIF